MKCPLCNQDITDSINHEDVCENRNHPIFHRKTQIIKDFAIKYNIPVHELRLKRNIIGLPNWEYNYPDWMIS